MFEGNASYLYIANVARGTDTVTGMANGSIAIVNEAGAVVSTSQVAVTGKYRVANKKDDGVINFSPEFSIVGQDDIIGTSYVAPVQQVSYLGYNGVSGAMDASADTLYMFYLEWLNSQFSVNNTPIRFSAQYQTVGSSQYELTQGILNSLEGVISRQPFGFVKTEKVNSATVTAANDFLADATVVNGLTAITIAESAGSAADAGEYATDTAIVIGDYVRIGDIGAGTALTSSVYKVISVSGISTAAATIVVDGPIKATSGTYTAATSDIEVIPAATAVAADFGIKFTGVENANFNPVNDTYEITSFKLIASDFTTAEITYSTEANKGSGYGKIIANLETYAQFLDKNGVIGAYPEILRTQNAIAANSYDMISFEVVAPTFTSATNGMTVNHSFRIQMAIKESLSGDSIGTVLGVTV